MKILNLLLFSIPAIISAMVAATVQSQEVTFAASLNFPEKFHFGLVGNRRDLTPDTAQGILIWNHGVIPSGHRASEAPPPSWLWPVEAAGWRLAAVLRDEADETADGVQALRVVTDWARQEGYRRIVIAGESRGGWLSILVASERDDLWGVIATAPGIYGVESSDAVDRTARELVAQLRRVTAPRVALFFFAGDDNEALPGGRGVPSVAALQPGRTSDGRAFLVVDRPDGLLGHWAGSYRPFARRFGPCIARFLTEPDLVGAQTCPAEAETADTPP